MRSCFCENNHNLASWHNFNLFVFVFYTIMNLFLFCENFFNYEIKESNYHLRDPHSWDLIFGLALISASVSCCLIIFCKFFILVVFDVWIFFICLRFVFDLELIMELCIFYVFLYFFLLSLVIFLVLFNIFYLFFWWKKKIMHFQLMKVNASSVFLNDSKSR